jgi:hypothetical protein
MLQWMNRDGTGRGIERSDLRRRDESRRGEV